MKKRKDYFLRIFSLVFLTAALLVTIGNIGLISAPFQDNTSLSQNVYDCGGILNTTNGYYSLNRSINSTGTCITISANNITLDCKGFNINYSAGGAASTYGVYSDQFNTTIKNCNITDGNFTLTPPVVSRYGIYFNTNNYSTIYNSTINVSNSIAIYLYNGVNYNNVSFNNVTSSLGYGIDIYPHSDNNLLKNNNIVSIQNNGIMIQASSNNNLTLNNATSNSGSGIYLYISSNNTLISNNATSNSSYGIYFESTSNNTLISNNATSNSSSGIYLTTSQWNNLTGNIGKTSSATVTISGIYLASGNNTLTSNTGMSTSGSCGIILFTNANNNNLTNNNGTSYSGAGIYLSTSSNNTLIGNNGNGSLSGGGSIGGISLESNSNNNILINNTGRANIGQGIYLDSSSNNILTGNNGVSNTDIGFYLYDGSNSNTLTSNNGTSNGNSGGIYIYAGSNNNLTSNIGRGGGGGIGISYQYNANNILINNLGIGNLGDGIIIDTSSRNNLTSNNGTSNNHYGIELIDSSNNSLTNNSANSNTQSGIWLYSSSNVSVLNQRAIGGTYGIYLRNSNNTLFKDCINISGVTDDIYYYSGDGSVNNTFINCSYNLSKELVQGASNQLIREWTYQAYVNDSSGNPLNNVNLAISHVSGTTVVSATTNSSGYIPVQPLIDYVNTGGTSTYASNYTVTAALSGYTSTGKTFNLTTLQNLNDFLTMSLAPVVSSTPPEEQSGGSLPLSSSSENTVYVPAALNDNFWTETTIILADNWQPVQEFSLTGESTPITEPEAQTLEQQLINELKTNPNAETREITIKEITENLSTGERVNVDVKNSSYYVGVANVSKDSVVVQVSGGGGSTTQSLMKLGEIKKFDLNGDGLIDMKIEIVNIEPNQKAGIKISVVYNGLLNAKEIQQYNQNQKSNKLLMFAFIFIGVLIAITIYFRFRKYK